MNKKFFTLAVSVLLTSAFTSVSAINTTTSPDKVVAANGTKDDGHEFKSGKKYYVAMTAADGTLTDGEFVLGIKNTDGTLSATTAAAENVKFDDENIAQYLWVVEKAVGTDGKTYYTFKNPEAGAYLSFDKSGNLVTKKTEAVAGKADKSIYFYFGSNDSYDGKGQLLKSAAKAPDNELTLSENGIAVGVTGDNKIVLFEAAENTMTADELNSQYLGDGFSLKFAKEPTENIFSQTVKAYNLAATVAPKAGTYFAISTPAEGINTPDDFEASTFIAINLEKNYGFNALDPKAGQGYEFTIVGGNVLKKDADIEKDELPVENAMFTVTEKYPTNDPGKYTLTMSATVIKDGKYDAGQNVAVGVVTNAGTNYLTTTSVNGATVAQFGASNIIKPESLLKADAPAVYQIMFTSGADKVSGSNSSEYGKYLRVSTTTTGASTTWSLLADGSDYTMMNAPIAQWTIVGVDENGSFIFRNRETNVEIKLGLYDQNNAILVHGAKICTGKWDTPADVTDAKFIYGYVNRANEHVYSSTYGEINAKNIQLIPVESVDPMAGFLNLSDEAIAYGPVKLNFKKQDSRIADDLLLTVVDNDKVEAHKQEAGFTLWNITKFDKSAAELKAAKSDTILNVKGYAYWDATKKLVKTVASGDTVAVLSYAFNPVNSDKYLKADASAIATVTNSTPMGKFIFKQNLDGSYSMLKSDKKYTDMIKADGNVASLNTGTGKVEFNSSTIYADKDSYRAVSLLREDMVSLKGELRHAAFQAVNGGFMAVGKDMQAVVAPADASAENLTFWLDTADVNTYLPSFFISKGIAEKTERAFLYNAYDSAYYYSTGAASEVKDFNYIMKNQGEEIVKAIFRPATLVNADTLTTQVKGETVTVAAVASKGVLAGLNNYKFNIVLKDAATEGDYVIRSLSNAQYLYSLNGKIGLTSNLNEALVVTVEDGIIPTGNESIDNATSSIVVTGNAGSVTIQGAQGETAYVRNLLGMPLAETVVTSDNATIAVPAGIVLVTVGDETVKVVVK